MEHHGVSGEFCDSGRPAEYRDSAPEFTDDPSAYFANFLRLTELSDEVRTRIVALHNTYGDAFAVYLQSGLDDTRSPDIERNFLARYLGAFGSPRDIGQHLHELGFFHRGLPNGGSAEEIDRQYQAVYRMLLGAVMVIGTTDEGRRHVFLR